MGMEDFSNSSGSEAGVSEHGVETVEAGIEDIESLEADTEALCEKASQLAGEINEPSFLEKASQLGEERSEIYNKLQEVHQSWNDVKERAVAIGMSSAAIVSLTALVAPTLNNPTVAEYAVHMQDGGKLGMAAIAINLAGLAINKFVHSIKEKTYENQGEEISEQQQEVFQNLSSEEFAEYLKA